MDYQNTLKYLYESVPMFQQIGDKAYKPGLETTYQLDEYFGHPHQQFRTIHIAGTNGKGSCSHTIAAVLQAAGYRVGLYTSPHLIDFRERIRINGEKMPEEYVVRFVEDHRSFFEPLHPSFFELTTAMAFRYFADQKVDVAVIEVGMGGRLDCTNIIKPELCVITNIGFDHMQYLGNTLTKIAKEKAGIIKEGTPVVIGRAAGSVKRVFTLKAKEMRAPILYAETFQVHCIIEQQSYSQLKDRRKLLEEILETEQILLKDIGEELTMEYKRAFDLLNPTQNILALDRILDKKKDAISIETPFFPLGLYMELGGACQIENSLTIICALDRLKEMDFNISEEDYLTGFSNVCGMTGLMGRWQKLQSYPDVICDTGHNVDGIRYVCDHLQSIHEDSHKNIHIVFGMVNDKDISSVLEILPKDATYYFTKASVQRALPEDELMNLATQAGLKGNSYPTVVDAVRAAKENCLPEDFIFVGGSNFIVADLLTNRDALNLY